MNTLLRLFLPTFPRTVSYSGAKPRAQMVPITTLACSDRSTSQQQQQQQVQLREEQEQRKKETELRHERPRPLPPPPSKPIARPHRAQPGRVLAGAGERHVEHAAACGAGQDERHALRRHKIGAKLLGLRRQDEKPQEHTFYDKTGNGYGSSCWAKGGASC